MDFGEAIHAMKGGETVTRRGWNGRGMFLYLRKGRRIPMDEWTVTIPGEKPTEEEIAQGYVEILPHIDMYTVNRDGRRARLCGWLASQTDMLSDDWEIVE